MFDHWPFSRKLHTVTTTHVHTHLRTYIHIYIYLYLSFYFYIYIYIIYKHTIHTNKIYSYSLIILNRLNPFALSLFVLVFFELNVWIIHNHALLCFLVFYLLKVESFSTPLSISYSIAIIDATEVQAEIEFRAIILPVFSNSFDNFECECQNENLQQNLKK